MATLVNGNGNPAVYAQQDADLYVGVMGTTSCIMSVGSKFAATIETANLISVADGVILTKEGRRIQTDVGEVDEFNIPNGATGVTRYYIIGYHLYTDGQGSQKCETFVQLMSSATDTIPEAEFRNGATEVYVSLYRVTQVGLTLNDPESLLPDALNLGDINASLTQINKMDNIVDCSTARNVAAKVISLQGFVLQKNARVIVRFTNTGSSNPASGNLTLNVNGTGAKNIIDGHSNNTTMTYSNGSYFFNNQVCEFIYNGTAWVWLNRDSNTTYTGGTLKTAAAKTGSGSTVTNTIAANTTIDNAIGTLLNNDYKINASLTEKVAQHSDTTYSAVKGLGYDATGKKLGLVVSQGGADTVIPFSGGDWAEALLSMTFFDSTHFTRSGGTLSFTNIPKGKYFMQGYSNYITNVVDTANIKFTPLHNWDVMYNRMYIVTIVDDITTTQTTSVSVAAADVAIKLYYVDTD